MRIFIVILEVLRYLKKKKPFLRFWGFFLFFYIILVVLIWEVQGYFSNYLGFRAFLSFSRFCGGILVIFRFLWVLLSFLQFQWYFSHFRILDASYHDEPNSPKRLKTNVIWTNSERMNVWQLYNIDQRNYMTGLLRMVEEMYNFVF